MRNLLTVIMLVMATFAFAQRNLEKTISPGTAQRIEMVFDDPELVSVHTWDKKEVRITGTVSINQGENDDAFELNSEIRNNILSIWSDIKNRDNIPRRVIIRKGDQDYFFKAKDMHDPAVRKFLEENGNEYQYMSNGIIKKITLDIYLPKGMQCKIDAKYGLVEITGFDAPLTVNATYGGVDATIISGATGELVARTNFGEILTNLDVKFTPVRSTDHGHWTEIRSNPGRGPSYEFVSKFGKVYLRKPQ